MRGFSISLLPLDDARAAMLAAPVAVPAWPAPQRVARSVATLPLPAELVAAAEEPSRDPAVRRALEVICGTLIDAQTALDALDARVGDGDTGSTFAAAARRVVDDLDALPLGSRDALCRALAERLSRVMGGSSGVLMSIFVAAAGAAFGAGATLPSALRAGLDRLQHYGGARAGDRTMIDALEPAIAALERGEGVGGAAAAARAGAQATASMRSARAGRASYVGGTDLAGVVDPGAEAVARVFEALARAS
jgi:dihydroxyacetone kinase